MILATQYFVQTAHGPMPADCIEQAALHFDELTADGVPVRVFKLEFDVETNAFETAREITGDFAERLV